MNFWMPQTGKMGDGWAYTYTSDKIRGFKQTHQPSPWINDYGQFSIMPMTGRLKIDQEQRASWFSHKAEKAMPHYYSVYLSEYNLTTEITPTERCAYFRFTFPQADKAYVVVDAFDRGSYIKVIPEEQKIVATPHATAEACPRISATTSSSSSTSLSPSTKCGLTIIPWRNTSNCNPTT